MAQDTVVVAQHVRTQTSKRVPRPKAKSTDSTEAIDVQVQDWNLNGPARTTSPLKATSTASSTWSAIVAGLCDELLAELRQVTASADPDEVRELLRDVAAEVDERRYSWPD